MMVIAAGILLFLHLTTGAPLLKTHVFPQVCLTSADCEGFNHVCARQDGHGFGHCIAKQTAALATQSDHEGDHSYLNIQANSDLENVDLNKVEQKQGNGVPWNRGEQALPSQLTSDNTRILQSSLEHIASGSSGGSQLSFNDSSAENNDYSHAAKNGTDTSNTQFKSFSASGNKIIQESDLMRNLGRRHTYNHSDRKRSLDLDIDLDTTLEDLELVNGTFVNATLKIRHGSAPTATEDSAVRPTRLPLPAATTMNQVEFRGKLRVKITPDAMQNPTKNLQKHLQDVAMTIYNDPRSLDEIPYTAKGQEIKINYDELEKLLNIIQAFVKQENKLNDTSDDDRHTENVISVDETEVGEANETGGDNPYQSEGVSDNNIHPQTGTEKQDSYPEGQDDSPGESENERVSDNTVGSDNQQDSNSVEQDDADNEDDTRSRMKNEADTDGQQNSDTLGQSDTEGDSIQSDITNVLAKKGSPTDTDDNDNEVDISYGNKNIGNGQMNKRDVLSAVTNIFHESYEHRPSMAELAAKLHDEQINGKEEDEDARRKRSRESIIELAPEYDDEDDFEPIEKSVNNADGAGTSTDSGYNQLDAQLRRPRYGNENTTGKDPSHVITVGGTTTVPQYVSMGRSMDKESLSNLLWRETVTSTPAPVLSSEWSKCSVTCGLGTQIRRRPCSTATICQDMSETKPCMRPVCRRE